MGADIHMYIEYASKTPSPHATRTGKRWWSNFGGRINPGRNYSLFGLISGVRDDRYGPVVEPRGYPDDAGYVADEDAYLRINDEYADNDGYCSLASAESWAKYGSTIECNDSGKPVRVTAPDWHSHTWLTPDELAAVYARYDELFANDDYKIGVEWRAMLAAMRALECNGQNDVRVIIWFDN